MEDEHDVIVELEDSVILALALQAHEKGVTLNQHIVDVIRKAMEE